MNKEEKEKLALGLLDYMKSKGVDRKDFKKLLSNAYKRTSEEE